MHSAWLSIDSPLMTASRSTRMPSRRSRSSSRSPGTTGSVCGNWPATCSPHQSHRSPLAGAGQINLLLDSEIEQTSFTDRLDEITLLTLLLWGSYDFVVPAGLGEDARAVMPDAELVVMERSGHSPMFNQPDAVTDSILDFIKRTD